MKAPSYIPFLLLIICMLMASCHLRPAYSQKYNEALTDELNSIEVEPVATIDGAEFYHRLTTILSSSAPTKYRLKVQWESASFPNTIEKNSDVLRGAIVQRINYTLYDAKTNSTLTSGRFQNISSYNAIIIPYGVDVEKDGMQIHVAHQTAEEVRTRLILYFNKKL